MLINKLQEELRAAQQSGDVAKANSLEKKLKTMLTTPPESTKMKVEFFEERPQRKLSGWVGMISRQKVPETKPEWMSDGRWRAILKQLWNNQPSKTQKRYKR